MEHYKTKTQVLNMEKNYDYIERMFQGFWKMAHPDIFSYGPEKANQIFEAFVAGLGCYWAMTELETPEKIKMANEQIRQAQIAILEASGITIEELKAKLGE